MDRSKRQRSSQPGGRGNDSTRALFEILSTPPTSTKMLASNQGGPEKSNVDSGESSTAKDSPSPETKEEEVTQSPLQDNHLNASLELTVCTAGNSASVPSPTKRGPAETTVPRPTEKVGVSSSRRETTPAPTARQSQLDSPREREEERDMEMMEVARENEERLVVEEKRRGRRYMWQEEKFQDPVMEAKRERAIKARRHWE